MRYLKSPIVTAKYEKKYLNGKAGMKRTEHIKDNPSPPLPYMFSFYLVYTCINVCHAVGDSLTRNLFK